MSIFKTQFLGCVSSFLLFTAQAQQPVPSPANAQRPDTTRRAPGMPPAVSTASFGGGFGPAAPSLVSAEKSDVRTVVKSHLQRLKAEASTAAGLYTDTMSKIHLQDISDRISKALDPK
jgi:hypothetical protein